MFNWNYLESFVILSENLSFSETARVLNTAQPVISRQIRILEESLGYPLFLRTKKRVTLSQEGLKLKSQLGPLVEEIKRLLDERREPFNLFEGIFRIGSMYEGGQILLFPKIKKFLSHHPGLQIHFNLMSTKLINEAILAGQLDFGFVYQVSDRKALKSVAVAQDIPVLVSDKKTSSKWKSSSVYHLIGYRERDTFAEAFIRRNFSKKEAQKFKISSSINSHAEIIELLKQQPGGMAVLPLTSAQNAIEKGQIQVLVREKKPQNLYLICNEQILLDQRKKALWNLLVQSFQASDSKISFDR